MLTKSSSSPGLSTPMEPPLGSTDAFATSTGGPSTKPAAPRAADPLAGAGVRPSGGVGVAVPHADTSTTIPRDRTAKTRLPVTASPARSRTRDRRSLRSGGERIQNREELGTPCGLRVCRAPEPPACRKSHAYRESIASAVGPRRPDEGPLGPAPGAQTHPRQEGPGRHVAASCDGSRAANASLRREDASVSAGTRPTCRPCSGSSRPGRPGR
jgi:hypothetical protein